MRRGEIAETRCDIDFHHPEYVGMVNRINSLTHTARIAEIISVPLSSGFAAGKDARSQPGDDSVPQIRPTQILADGEIDLSAAYGIAVESVADSAYLRSGEVLFNNTNSSSLVGKSAVFDLSLSAVCSNHVTRLSLREGIQPEFVAMVLNALQRRGFFARLCTNFNMQAGINSETLGNVRIPLPPYQERERLIAAMDAARAERRSKLAEAEGLLAGVDEYLREALGLAAAPAAGRRVFAVRQVDIGERMDAWFNNPRYDQLNARLDAMPVATAELGELLLSISSGATPSRNNQSLYADAGIRFLRILNIDNGEITETDLKYITDAVHNGELNRSQLAVDDVLMTITGRVGSAAVVQAEHLPANINQHIVRMRIDQTRCRPEFLSLWLNSKDGLELANRYVSGGTRAALDYQAIRKIRIPLPATLAEQDAIIGRVSAVRQQAATLRAEAETGWRAAGEWFEGEVLGHQR